ncbi:unnamed protein product [Periconia digitata]|uniref:YDG domain-containing protein n=1 Tax=Periconia digitata TaxID=1303443 RepID=A0A9W4UPZ1_9PLEO|nr:unnamed protein product [Periconia digitata]
MAGKPVNMEYPNWLKKRIEDSTKIWGVPPDRVIRQIEEQGRIVGNPVQRRPSPPRVIQSSHNMNFGGETEEPIRRVQNSIQPSSPPRIIQSSNDMNFGRETEGSVGRVQNLIQAISPPRIILSSSPPRIIQSSSPPRITKSSSRPRITKSSSRPRIIQSSNDMDFRLQRIDALLSSRDPILGRPSNNALPGSSYQMPMEIDDDDDDPVVVSNPNTTSIRTVSVETHKSGSSKKRPSSIRLPSNGISKSGPSTRRPPSHRPSKSGLIGNIPSTSGPSRDKRPVVSPNPISNSNFDSHEQVNGAEPKQFVAKPLPIWYESIKTTSLGMKNINKHPTYDQSQANTALSSMKSCILYCEQGKDEFDELRDQIHKAEILLRVDKYVVRKNRMLEPAYGLPRIFATTLMKVPEDLRMDSWQLYLRWHQEVFEIDILRGIEVRMGRDRSADRIASTWKKVNARYYGEGDLVLGQWWPTQLCLVRDGAHGAAQGGIYGEKLRGAFSIVLSGGSQYEDEDKGDTIWYSGTDGKNSKPTENTLRMVESCDTVHNNVRVFRSHQLSKKNPFRPEVGLRYDGLYTVQQKQLRDEEKQIFRFLLVRCKNQHPIRYGDNSWARPTKFEIQEDTKLRLHGRA